MSRGRDWQISNGLSFFHDEWQGVPDFNKATPCPAVPNNPTNNAREDNTIWFNSGMLHYSLHGTDFVAREEIYEEWNNRLADDVFRREFMNARFRDALGNPIPGHDPEVNVFHPAGNQLTGADMGDQARAWTLPRAWQRQSAERLYRSGNFRSRS